MHFESTAQKEEEESSKIGTVSNHVYFGYVKSGANIISGLFLCLMAIGYFGAQTFSDLWISKWTNVDDTQLYIYNRHNSNLKAFIFYQRRY